MGLFRVPDGLALRYWQGESTALVRLDEAGTTSLIEAEAAAVLQALLEHPDGLGVRAIMQALGLGAEPDPEVDAGVRRLLDSLAAAGLLCRVQDDADARRATAD